MILFLIFVLLKYLIKKKIKILIAYIISFFNILIPEFPLLRFSSSNFFALLSLVILSVHYFSIFLLSLNLFLGWWTAGSISHSWYLSVQSVRKIDGVECDNSKKGFSTLICPWLFWVLFSLCKLLSLSVVSLLIRDFCLCIILLII